MNWLLLVIDLPSEPAYLRVKLGRRVQRFGAIGLKGAVYVLPDQREGLAAAARFREETVADGGQVTMLRAAVISGVSDGELERVFDRERRLEYAELVANCIALEQRWADALTEREIGACMSERGRLFGRLEEILMRDFFGSTASEGAMQAIERLARFGAGPGPFA